MLNTPWETGSLLYRRLVIAALVATGIGIVAAVAGALLNSPALLSLAMPIIIVG